ncbi:ornithine decarboxylase 1-like [Condylostylus longicornis]|uniref:ornithine decarboxylase 1-like n=1 Tax=Condylostylus longicornis TaxID=2530218 RepID=UPI00244DE826|nr:ornithine decarboxylase 1-like [Condylostylus longicornis]
MEGINFYNNKLNLNEIVNGVEYKNSDESLMICDLTELLKKYDQWIQYMPRVTPFYAVKCNDNIMVLKFLSSLGVSFDCASKAEIEKILSIDVEPERIIYAHPTKLIGHLEYAKANNVKMMTFDTDLELFKIKENYPDAELVLRICCEAKLALSPLGGKFGCEPITVAPKLLELAKKLNLNIVGISFHVGSNCLDHDAYDEAISKARDVFNIGKELGFKNLNLLDIGGGFPGSDDSAFQKMCGIINKSLDEYFPGDDVRFIAEPGRYFVTSAFKLICKIHSKLDSTETESQIPETVPNEELYKSCIWGPTCDALDIIWDDMNLPNLSINDAFVFDEMGAYSTTLSSGFNGFPQPKTLYYYDRQYTTKDSKYANNIIVNIDEGICSHSSCSDSNDSNDDDDNEIDSISSDDGADYANAKLSPDYAQDQKSFDLCRICIICQKMNSKVALRISSTF